jgi:hypothetical protein
VADDRAESLTGDHISGQDRRALERVTRGLVTGEAATGVLLEVTFPAANSRRDVAHGLGVIPTGYEIRMANGNVHATDVHLWTPTVAYLISDTANSFARVRFYTSREVPTNA